MGWGGVERIGSSYCLEAYSLPMKGEPEQRACEMYWPKMVTKSSNTECELQNCAVLHQWGGKPPPSKREWEISMSWCPPPPRCNGDGLLGRKMTEVSQEGPLFMWKLCGQRGCLKIKGNAGKREGKTFLAGNTFSHSGLHQNWRPSLCPLPGRRKSTECMEGSCLHSGALSSECLPRNVFRHLVGYHASWPYFMELVIYPDMTPWPFVCCLKSLTLLWYCYDFVLVLILCVIWHL